jgi:SAM-dependent methyltransferase
VSDQVETRSFYEGRFSRTDWSAGSLRNFLVKKERFFLRQIGNRKGKVLDLGCGGGWAFFTTVGPVVGVDLSLASVRAAGDVYPYGLVASLTNLPFPDDAFDFVVSLDVFGHVSMEDKDVVLGEIARVLRAGGETVHYVETEGDDPLMRFVQRDSQLYHKRILAPEGHIGLEPPQSTLARFRRPGWIPLREVPVYRGLMYVGRVLQYFDNEYRSKSKWIQALVAVGRAATRFRILEVATNLIISLLMEIGDRIFPATWAGGVLVAYRKAGCHRGEEGDLAWS